MQEKRVFLTRMHPRKHAQEAIFPVIYSVFLHISTDFDPQESANHRAPHPPMATAEKTSQRFQRFPSSPCPPPIGASWDYVGACSCWCSCCASGCLVSVLVVLEVVVSSLMLLVLLCLAYLGACCAVLGFMLEHLGTTC